MKKWALYLLLVLIIGCKSNDEQTLHKLSGETMGTYYKISYYSTSSKVEKEEIDQFLVAFNNELSTYTPTSTISKFNQAKTSFSLALNSSKQNTLLFDHVFMEAKAIYNITNGYFDPTIMPLVNYWGFGYTQKEENFVVDSNKVKKLLVLVGFDKITRKEQSGEIKYHKPNPSIQLDFSAIAKGYGVDRISLFLQKKGIKNFLIDIGGELVARGTKPNKKYWTIGISKPLEDANFNEFMELVRLKDIAIASSGNYRNFFESNGNKYSHTINTKTGFTEKSSLLSTSIIADNCMKADAYATACMVMGLKKSKILIESIKGVEACFISNIDGKLVFDYSKGWKENT